MAQDVIVDVVVTVDVIHPETRATIIKAGDVMTPTLWAALDASGADHVQGVLTALRNASGSEIASLTLTAPMTAHLPPWAVVGIVPA